ncbi:MAG: hypothetical protein HY268_24170 [Deltaproteobacteria bacterium]|nr:hypothetical protein [Deltaproteobacteria bacterium]
MTAPSALIEFTRQRLLHQRQLNVLGFFLPLAIATGVAGWLLLGAFSFPSLLAVIPPVLCGSLLIVSLWHLGKEVGRETVAALLDEKTAGKGRFLTLATCPETQANTPFLTLVDQQATSKIAAFEPARDLPFKLDKRVFAALLAAALSLLILFLLPPTLTLSTPGPDSAPSTLLTELEETARTLMSKGATPQEQVTGAQLLALAQELKDPTLSPQEKQRLIDEAQQRMKLNLSLPQILPFDLKLFATENKNNNGQGNQGDQQQPDNQPLAKANQNLEQLKKTLSSAAGNEPQPGPPKDGEQKEQQPREAGGGIKFNMPQPPPGKQQERPGQEPSGQQQKSSQDQTPNNQMQTAGTDPNRPGGQQDQGQNQNKNGPTPNPQQNEPQEKGRGSTIGGSPGERFLQPGEQPGGFLTKDARFVKVRIPVGEEIKGESDRRTENRGPAQPKVPYSNAPLKEGPPDQAQPKQPIPLEYRKILQ